MKTMIKNKQIILSFFMMMALVFISVTGTYAQSHPWNIEGRAGIGIPSAALSDIENVGPDIALKGSYFLTPNLEIRADGEVEALSGKGNNADMQLWHYTVGAGWSFTNPEVTPWTFNINAGAGATTIHNDSYSTIGSFTQTYFTIGYGARIGYDVSRQVNVFVSGKAYTIFGTHSSTRYFAGIPGGRSFGAVTSFPITAGVSVRL